MDKNHIDKIFQKAANKKKAKILQRFFKTGIGEYGQGDIFLGITVPKSREIVKKLKDISYNEIDNLIKDPIHEKRLVGLLILVHNYEIADKINEEKTKKKIYNYYLKNAKRVNNWDLVDLTAPKIVGSYLLKKDKKILYKLAKSNNLWEKRISILSTFWFIRNKQYKDGLKISKILINDSHDLIHKAVGWMLREIGKREQKIEEDFLKEKINKTSRYKQMPRTMLRYSIERFEENKRKRYLKGLI